MKRFHANMWRSIALSFFVCLSITAQAQSTNPKFDKRLADSLGGDEYGMKSYVLVMLKTGKATITDKGIVDSLFQEHMANIGRLAKEGKLVVAGPLQKNDKAYGGIFILAVNSVDEAEALLQTDPAISSQLLDSECYGWYGSAALPMYLQFHEKIEQQGF